MSCDKTTASGRPINQITDRGVKYTGDDIESLGICSGMYLDQIEVIVLQRLQDYAEGIGISLPEVDYTECTFIEGFIACCAADNTLTGLIETIFKALCNTDGRITANGQAITNIQAATNYTIVPGCLTVSNTKIDTVLNALIASYCTFVQKVTAIFGSLDNPVVNTSIVNQITDSVLNTVLSNIKGCGANDVIKIGTGINTQIELRGAVPIGGFLFGYWDASYFDNTGAGLASKGLCGYAQCNGLNNTPDYRGMTLAMMTNVYSDRTLNGIVDPTLNSDADYATTLGTIKGQVKHKLTGLESALASHTHTATQAAHSHANGAFDRVLQYTATDTAGSTDSDNRTGSEPDIAHSQPMLPATPAITVNPNAAVDAVSAHENRQPTAYVNMVIRVY